MATQNKNLIVLNSGQLEKASSTDTIQVYNLVVDAGASITGDTKISGDLEVTGSIVSKNVENVLVRDAFLDLAFGNTTDAPQAGGLTVSMNRNAAFTAETVTEFAKGVTGTTAPKFTVSGGSSAFVAGDIVAITGATDVNNDGLYVVDSVASGVVTIKGFGGTSPSPSVPFVQNQFTDGADQSASAYKVDLAVASFADGTSAFKDPDGNAWAKGLFVTAYAYGQSMPALGRNGAKEADFTANGAYDTAAQTSLQEAYVTGNTITTSVGEGPVTIQGTEKLVVSATVGVQITQLLDLDGSMDADVSSYDVNSTGAYTVTAANASSISTSGAGQDLTLDAQAASLVLDGGEAAIDAVRIFASNAAGGIDVDAGTGGITVDSTGKIDLVAATASKFESSGNLTLESKTTGTTYVKSAVKVQVDSALVDVNSTGAVTVDAAAASNFTVAGFDLTLSTTTAGNVAINAAMNIDADAVDMTLDATGYISLDSVNASNFTVSTGDLTLKATAASVVVEGGEAAADAVWVKASNAAGGIDIDAGTGGITVDTSGALSLDSTALASNLSLTANSGSKATLTIAASNTGAGVADLDIDADGAVTIDGATFSIDATGVSNLTTTGANLTVSTITSGVLAVSAAGNLDMDSLGAVTIDAVDTIGIGVNPNDKAINIGTNGIRTITVGNAAGASALDVNLGSGGMTVDTLSGGAISLDAIGAASNFTVDGGNLTLSTVTTGNLVLTGAGLVDINAGTDVEIDAAFGVSIDALKNSNFTVTGAGQSLTLAAAGGGAQKVSIGSAGTGADAVVVNATSGGIDINAGSAGVTVDTTGVLSLDSADTTNLTMTANAAGNKVLTVEANNTDASGFAQLAIKAKSTIQIGDSAAYSTAFIDVQNFLAFQQAAGLDVEAGEMLAVGDAVVAKWDAGSSKVRYFKASNAAGSDLERNVHGIAQTSAGAAGNKFKLGTVSGTLMSTALAGASADLGKPVFLGTGGALTTTPPTSAGTSVFRVGFVATNTGKVMFQPQFIAKVL